MSLSEKSCPTPTVLVSPSEPNPVTTTWDWEGHCLRIPFSAPINRGGKISSSDCSLLFTPQALAKIGPTAQCYWLSDCQLEICHIPTDAIISASQTALELELLPGTVLSRSLEKSVVLRIPDVREDSPLPVALMKAPSLQSLRNNLTLDGSYSRSAIGGPLHYCWFTIEQRDDIDIPILLASGPQSTLILEVEQWQVQSYRFYLEVTDSLDAKSVSELVEISLIDSILPEIDIPIPSILYNVNPANTAFFFAEVNTAIKWNHYWRLVENSDGKMIHTHQIVNQPHLMLPSDPQILRFNESYFLHHYFQLSSTVTITSTTQIHMAPSGLICAYITRGNYSINQNQILLLDGSRSYDVQKEPDALLFTWSCEMEIPAPDSCGIFRDPCVNQYTGSALSFKNRASEYFNPRTLAPGVYYFTLRASKGNRFGETSARVEILPETGTQWNAWIDAPVCGPISSESLKLEGHCDDGDQGDEDNLQLGSYRWSASIPLEKGFITTGNTSKMIAFTPYAFPEGSHWIRLTCVLPSGLESGANATYQFSNTKNPFGGHFQALLLPRPSSSECNSQYRLEAVNWQSHSPKNSLFYQFGYSDPLSGAFQSLSFSGSQKPSLVTSLPSGVAPNYDVELLLRVEDGFGGSSQVSFIVQVLPLPSLLPEQMLRVFDRIRFEVNQGQVIQAFLLTQCALESTVDPVDSLLELLERSMNLFSCRSDLVPLQMRTLARLTEFPFTPSGIQTTTRILSSFHSCLQGANDSVIVDGILSTSSLLNDSNSLNLNQLQVIRSFLEYVRAIRGKFGVCGQLLEPVSTPLLRIETSLAYPEEDHHFRTAVGQDTLESSFVGGIVIQSGTLKHLRADKCVAFDFAFSQRDLFRSPRQR